MQRFRMNKLVSMSPPSIVTGCAHRVLGLPIPDEEWERCIVRVVRTRPLDLSNAGGERMSVKKRDQSSSEIHDRPAVARGDRGG